MRTPASRETGSVCCCVGRRPRPSGSGRDRTRLARVAGRSRREDRAPQVDGRLWLAPAPCCAQRLDGASCLLVELPDEVTGRELPRQLVSLPCPKVQHLGITGLSFVS